MGGGRAARRGAEQANMDRFRIWSASPWKSKLSVFCDTLCSSAGESCAMTCAIGLNEECAQRHDTMPLQRGRVS